MRLIDADELMGITEETALAWEYRRIVSDIRNIIEKAPTIEAEPVKHGQWIYSEPNKYGSRHLMCSACGEEAYSDECEYYRGKYCPHCGAKMDG